MAQALSKNNEGFLIGGPRLRFHYLKILGNCWNSDKHLLHPQGFPERIGWRLLLYKKITVNSIHLWDLRYINLSPYKNRIIFSVVQHFIMEFTASGYHSESLLFVSFFWTSFHSLSSREYIGYSLHFLFFFILNSRRLTDVSNFFFLL